MEILQAASDKKVQQQSSKRFTTSLVALFIAFPVVILTLTLYPNTSVMDKNITTSTIPLEEIRVLNISHDNIGGEVGTYNNTVPDSEVGEKSQNDQEKLLHGLLASGFDEASCLSRLESHFYRKPSPHKPSPYLISKLRNYEQVHTRCGPNTRAYNRSMAKIVKNNGASSSSSCKYIVWTPANGLANQMLSITATFLYALLTDRVLLVKIGKDIHGLFCEPFLNSTWTLPEKSPFWNMGQFQTYQSMLLEENKANSTTKEHLPPSVLFVNLAHTRDEKFFHCDHSQDLLHKVSLLILLSDQYFVPSLFMTPVFDSKINKMFPEKDTVFHHLGRYLFHPSNEAWRLISRFYQEHLAKADEKLGLQIRLFNGDFVRKQAVMDVLMSCTIKNKLLPEIDTQNSSSSGQNLTVKAVMVASLYKEIGENLRAMYLKRPTVTGELVEVFQPSHEEHEMFNDYEHYLKAWTDIYLLSLSDVLVTTYMSTFGYVAQSLGNLRPWLLYQLGSNDTRVPLCTQDFSMEPCYHFAPSHHCNGKPIEDFSSFLYLRKCKDMSTGVKLVNNSV